MGYSMCTRIEELAVDGINMSMILGILDAQDVLDWETMPDPLPHDPDLSDDDIRRREIEWGSIESPDRGRVPAFKLHCNDMQRVTPRECQLIACALRTADRGTIEEIVKRCMAAVSKDFGIPETELNGQRSPLGGVLCLITDFAGFCERAGDTGGFLVL